MKPRYHTTDPLWPDDIKAARAVQLALMGKVRIRPLGKDPEYIAGVDASYSGGMVIAVACLYRYSTLEYMGFTHSVRECRFPYVPGLLTFREGRAIAEAIAAHRPRPGLILFDGQGIASHMGVLLDVPTVGCAKSRLMGEHAEPGRRRGSRRKLLYKGTTVGVVLRTRDGVRPLFVSPGHLVDIDDAARMVLRTATIYRQPEPLRRAHKICDEIRAKMLL